ncbi:hypothetical protein [Bradyrhizobium jicamae]|uniref:hypothetical protein n=1 Tax=Bradyrhizobium jicamae TaxID=280332 RepID=UPI001BA71F6C|nr:hypothetical protein [Bradyrhizobium jicamae]MBR0932933.1 hypothetical protein [Bradyrhizobium jicamae]
MTIAKSTVLALAISAALAGPVLAQGVSSDSQMRGTAQGQGMQGGGMSGSGDEELAVQPGASAQKGSVNARTGTKATVGSARGTPKTTGTETAPGTRKY